MHNPISKAAGSESGLKVARQLVRRCSAGVLQGGDPAVSSREVLCGRNDLREKCSAKVPIHRLLVLTAWCLHCIASWNRHIDISVHGNRNVNAILGMHADLDSDSLDVMLGPAQKLVFAMQMDGIACAIFFTCGHHAFAKTIGFMSPCFTP